MRCPDEIAVLVAQIILEGVLAARAAAWGNDSEQSAIETDHIHNLPLVFYNYAPHDLHYYWEIERTSYITQSKEKWPQRFVPLWEALEPLIAALPKDS